MDHPIFVKILFLPLVFFMIGTHPCNAGGDKLAPAFQVLEQDLANESDVTPVPLIHLNAELGNQVTFLAANDQSNLPMSEWPESEKIRLVLISDIHIFDQQLGYFEETAIPMTEMALKMPKGDLLIIAGDLTGTGSLKELKEFRQFIDAIYARGVYRTIIFIPGNHERILDEPYYLRKGYLTHEDVSDPSGEIQRAREALTQGLPENVVYLVDKSIVVENYHIYGTPWVEGDSKWAFSIKKRFLEEKWAEIPENTEILISHTPPYLHGDFEEVEGRVRVGYHHTKTYSWMHTGSESLLNRVLQIQPCVHIFGHTHEGYGATTHRGCPTLFINAATCDANYHPLQQPIVIDLPRKESAD